MDDQRVTPLAMDDADAPPPPPSMHQPGPAVRRYAALAIGALAIALIAAIAFVVESPSVAPVADEAPPVSYSTREQRVHLDDRDQPVLVLESTSDEWAIAWDPIAKRPSQSTGTIGLIPFDPSPPYVPLLADASMTYTMIEACSGATCRVEVSMLTGPVEPVATLDGSLGAWHANEPGRIAWTSSGEVERASTAVLSEDGDWSELRTEFILQTGERIVRYDQSGFVTVADVIRVRTPGGEELWSTTGRLVDVTDRLVIVVDEPAWTIFDRASGHVIARSDAATGAPAIAADVLGTSARGGDAESTLVTVDLDTVPPIDAAAPLIELGSSRDGSLRIIRSVEGNMITFRFDVGSVAPG